MLFELDGQPALDLYERYLGDDDAKGLPGTALLFPLIVQDPQRPDHEVVRTIVGIDRDAHALIFAGDMPEGWMARLMRGNFENLAAGAAEAARRRTPGSAPSTAGDVVSVMVSCIGRRLLLGQRITDEVEAAIEQLRSATRLGFFSYGEISPHAVSGVLRAAQPDHDRHHDRRSGLGEQQRAQALHQTACQGDPAGSARSNIDVLGALVMRRL